MISPKCVKLSKPSNLKSRIVRFCKYIYSTYAYYLVFVYVLNDAFSAKLDDLCSVPQDNIAPMYRATDQ